MSTNMKWIGEKAGKSPGLVFTSLYHHVTDIDNLRECYKAQDGRKAPGIDGITKEKYGENLEENLMELSGKYSKIRFAYKLEPLLFAAHFILIPQIR